MADLVGVQLQEAETGDYFLKGGFYLIFNLPQTQKIAWQKASEDQDPILRVAASGKRCLVLNLPLLALREVK